MTYFCPGKAEHYVVTALAMIGKSGVAGAWSAVQVFSAEVFPTVVR
jgi:MFS transporter, OCT family, solute carrier family 22 (organic cation transporter), member 4/5